jgi:integrase
MDMEEQASTFLKQARKRGGDQWAQDKLVGFITSLRSRSDKIEPPTVRNYYKAIKLFCDLNRVNLEWKRVVRYLGKGRKVANDRAPSIGEIRKLLEYPDRRIKAVVLVTLSSGMRIDAWNWLQLKHVIPLGGDGRVVDGDDKDKEIAAAKLIVYAGEPEQYFTFITPEAYNAVRDWADYRRQNGEDIGPDSWIMRDIWPQVERAFMAEVYQCCLQFHLKLRYRLPIIV